MVHKKNIAFFCSVLGIQNQRIRTRYIWKTDFIRLSVRFEKVFLQAITADGRCNGGRGRFWSVDGSFKVVFSLLWTVGWQAPRLPPWRQRADNTSCIIQNVHRVKNLSKTGNNASNSYK